MVFFFFFALRLFMPQIILTPWIPSAPLMSYDALHSHKVLPVHSLFLGSDFTEKESVLCLTPP